jgi:hypothetical protein
LVGESARQDECLSLGRHAIQDVCRPAPSNWDSDIGGSENGRTAGNDTPVEERIDVEERAGEAANGERTQAPCVAPLWSDQFTDAESGKDGDDQGNKPDDLGGIAKQPEPG